MYFHIKNLENNNIIFIVLFFFLNCFSILAKYKNIKFLYFLLSYFHYPYFLINYCYYGFTYFLQLTVVLLYFLLLFLTTRQECTAPIFSTYVCCSLTHANTHARTCLCNGVYVLFLTQTHTQIFPVFFNGRSYEVVLTRFFGENILKIIFYFFNFCFFFAVNSLSKDKGKFLFFSKKKTCMCFLLHFFMTLPLL